MQEPFFSIRQDTESTGPPATMMEIFNDGVKLTDHGFDQPDARTFRL